MIAHTLSDPSILPLVRSHNDNQVVPCRIVGVEKVYYKAQQAKTSRQYDELIVGSCFCEKVLLVFLRKYQPQTLKSQDMMVTSGNDSFTGPFPFSDGICKSP